MRHRWLSGRIEPCDIRRIVGVYLRSGLLERSLRNSKHMHTLHRRKVERFFWPRRQPMYELFDG